MVGETRVEFKMLLPVLFGMEAYGARRLVLVGSAELPGPPAPRWRNAVLGCDRPSTLVVAWLPSSLLYFYEVPVPCPAFAIPERSSRPAA
jgi:hypothetical protein